MGLSRCYLSIPAEGEGVAAATGGEGSRSRLICPIQFPSQLDQQMIARESTCTVHRHVTQ